MLPSLKEKLQTIPFVFEFVGATHIGLYITFSTSVNGFYFFTKNHKVLQMYVSELQNLRQISKLRVHLSSPLQIPNLLGSKRFEQR